MTTEITVYSKHYNEHFTIEEIQRNKEHFQEKYLNYNVLVDDVEDMADCLYTIEVFEKLQKDWFDAITESSVLIYEKPIVIPPFKPADPTKFELIPL